MEFNRNNLTHDQRQTIGRVVAVVVVVGVAWSRLPAVVSLVCGYLPYLIGLYLFAPATWFAPPTERSFDPYFKSWFLDNYMPALGRFHREQLRRKAAGQTGLDAFGTNIVRWFQKSTEGLNNLVMYELSLKHAVPKAYRLTGPLERFRIIQVNLGSRTRPAWFTFVGAWGRWRRIPLICTDWGVGLDIALACNDGGLLDYAEPPN